MKLKYKKLERYNSATTFYNYILYVIKLEDELRQQDYHKY